MIPFSIDNSYVELSTLLFPFYRTKSRDIEKLQFILNKRQSKNERDAALDSEFMQINLYLISISNILSYLDNSDY